jgi:hypothetical protein
LRIVESESGLDQVADVLAAAERQRLLSARLHREMFAEIRWSREAAERTGDGIDVRTLELDSTERAGMDILSRWEVMQTLRTLGGGRGLERPTRDAISSASAVAMITVPGQGPAAFHLGGRAVARVWLQATALGLAVQPMTALLFILARLAAGDDSDLEPDAVATFQQAGTGLATVFQPRRGDAPIMLFRLAMAPPPSAKSLRRKASVVVG